MVSFSSSYFFDCLKLINLLLQNPIRVYFYAVFISLMIIDGMSRPTKPNIDLELFKEDPNKMAMDKESSTVNTEKTDSPIQEILETKVINPQETKKVVSEESFDGMVGAENSIVFRPLFRYRQQSAQKSRQRYSDYN